MGFRFRRSVRLFPGVRLNFGKRGVSASVGVRGAHVTVGRTGVRTTVGIPGTGVSYTNFRSVKRRLRTAPNPTQSPQPRRSSVGSPTSLRTYLVLGYSAAALIGGAWLISRYPQIIGGPALVIGAPALAVVAWAASRIVGALGRARTTRADRQAQLDAERRYTEQTGFAVVHESAGESPP